MTPATLGFAFTLEHEALHSPDLRDEALRLMASPSWGPPLRYFSSIAVSGQKKVRRPGLLSAKERDGIYAEILATEATGTVGMASSARSDEEFAQFSIDTQIQPWSARKAKTCGLRPWEPTVTRSQWLIDVLTFAERAPANQGVVFAMATHAAAMAEAWASNITLPNGRDAHPRADQVSGMSVNHKEMGSRYVRFPRWGTFYSRAYVAQLGGADRIVEVVRPAVVRELGAGMYFQLTDSFESALSDEALAKQHAFELLAEPLLPPIG
ncbi:MAG: hypothetical protein F9K40_00085 [Kofleriaceae bacterium]|nr:MAG: hypothetical protein F9K40_00085 [Kofleriaceae bacterium]MBZ0234581.1 hypothetical protein [Kofleriaceae bacterium]